MSDMKKTILILLLFTIIYSCSKSSGDTTTTGPGGPGGGGPGGTTLDCSGVAKTFSADASPVFQTYCNIGGCHASGSVNGPGPLTNYTQIYGARVNIRSAVASGLMPQNTTLTASQKNTILCWIDSGAPNN
jgi:hypothetical protein